MISFDTNVLAYATAARADDGVSRAQDRCARDAGKNERAFTAECC